MCKFTAKQSPACVSYFTITLYIYVEVVVKNRVGDGWQFFIFMFGTKSY